MYGFKVLQKFNDRLYSYNPTVSDRAKSDGIVLEYIPRCWTIPTIPKSKLYVFLNVDDALVFESQLVESSYFQLWLCEIENPVKIKRLSDMSVQAPDFWKLKNSKKSLDGIWTKLAPIGTYGVDKVKLISRITF